MGIDNLFSLSIELTKVVPLATLGAEKTYGAALRLARELKVPSIQVQLRLPTYILKNSGSDIVVEEDLVALFGLVKIDEVLDRSFRASVNTGTDVTPLSASIGLMIGPGPTVNRALRNSHYWSTVMQCKYLIFNRVLLLTCQNFQKRRISPNRIGLHAS